MYINDQTAVSGWFVALLYTFGKNYLVSMSYFQAMYCSYSQHHVLVQIPLPRYVVHFVSISVLYLETASCRNAGKDCVHKTQSGCALPQAPRKRAPGCPFTVYSCILVYLLLAQLAVLLGSSVA
jgi:hypothetical protein